MARNKKTKMKFKDTKTSCPSYLHRDVDFSKEILKWIPCGGGYRAGLWYKCYDTNLMCPYHWPFDG